MENRLREIREAKGISQEALAEKSGVSRTTISVLECGEAKDTLTSTLTKLSEALEESIECIFFSSKSPTCLTKGEAS